MVKAFKGFGGVYGMDERRTFEVPHTHPERMALAAGVLLELRASEVPEIDDGSKDSSERHVGAKALESTMA